MTEVENPFGDGKLDSDDPSGSAESIGEGIVGYALFAFMLLIGLFLGAGAVQKIDGFLGTDMTDESNGVSVRGEI